MIIQIFQHIIIANSQLIASPPLLLVLSSSLTSFPHASSKECVSFLLQNRKNYNKINQLYIQLQTTYHQHAYPRLHRHRHRHLPLGWDWVLGLYNRHYIISCIIILKLDHLPLPAPAPALGLRPALLGQGPALAALGLGTRVI